MGASGAAKERNVSLICGGEIAAATIGYRRLSDFSRINGQPSNWLRANGCTARDISRKLTVQGRWAWFWDQLSTAKASWNGHNASGWKADLLRVNGFDTQMQYGGQDREFGERLENTGVRGKRIRHRAICVHLDHPRGYASQESIQRNRAIRAETRRLRSTWAANGLLVPAQAAPSQQDSAAPERRAA